MLGVICACVLVGGGDFLFPLWQAGLCKMVYFEVSMGILSADDCFCVFVLLFCLDEVSCTPSCCQLNDTRFCACLWKILKEMGIPNHLACLLRNLYAGQEATVRTGHGITDWFQIGKRVYQSCILSHCLFNPYAEYIMRNAGLEEAQAWFKIAGRNIITSDMWMTPPLWQKVQN